jgi:hypothetical protein
MRTRPFILVALIPWLILAGVVLAASSTNYGLPFSVSSNGGGERASTSYQLTDVLGQTAANTFESDNFRLRSGFLGPGSLIVLDATPPYAVNDLAISVASANSVVLEWTAPGDDGDAGTANQYEIRYSTLPITEGNWYSATSVVSKPAPSPVGTTEHCRVTGLSATDLYYFALMTADEVPNWSGLSNVIRCITLAGTDLSGNMTLTTGSGNGTFDPGTYEITSGHIEVSGGVNGDLIGTFSFKAFYNPSDGQWYATSVAQDVTLLGHPAVYLGTGEAFNYGLNFSPLGVTFDFWADVWAWTTDGSGISADIAACGSGGGGLTIDLDENAWYLTDPEARASYPSDPPCPIGIAIARDLVGAAARGNVTIPGSGTVVLGTVAQLDYTTTGTGTIILAQYTGNPGGTTPKLPLDTFIEVDSDIIALEITWPIELRVYYTDEELEAAGIDESTLTMYRWDGSNWVEVAESGVNTEENYVWAKLYSFSIYGPMGDPLSPAPRMVPTISRWGIIAMIAAFIGLLVWTVWRRRPVKS